MILNRKKHRLVVILIAIVIVICAFSGCSRNASEKDNGKINIVTTIFPEYDFATAITNDKADVEMLLAPGTSVHSFDPSPSDIKTIQNADVFIYVGGTSDVWVDNILESLDTSEMKIVRLMDYVETVPEEIIEGMTADGHDHESAEEHAEHSGGEHSEDIVEDEHIWTSPKNAMVLVKAIADVLCEVDGENSETYRDNADIYLEKLAVIDTKIEKVVSESKRDIIVVADKFPFKYFTDHYGLNYVAAFSGCSDQSDVSASTLIYLINTVTSKYIPYIFKVELTSGNVAEAISEETGAGVLLFHSGENISKDDFENGLTYIDFMNNNIENLEKALN